MSVRDVVNTHVDDCRVRFRTAVRPIYGSHSGNDVEAVGSCVLIEVDSKRYGITAAHALDNLTSNYSLHIAGRGGTRPVPVQGRIRTTNPEGDRDRDRYDFGFWQLTEEDQTNLGEVTFIGVSELLPSTSTTVRRLNLVMGFPISKNKGKRINRQKKSIQPSISSYTANGEAIPSWAQSGGYHEEDHIFIRYQKYAHDEEGRKVNVTSPKGLSGGAIFDLGNVGMEALVGVQPALAGIFIEQHKVHGYAVGVRIHNVVDAIRRESSQE